MMIQIYPVTLSQHVLGLHHTQANLLIIGLEGMPIQRMSVSISHLSYNKDPSDNRNILTSVLRYTYSEEKSYTVTCTPSD